MLHFPFVIFQFCCSLLLLAFPRATVADQCQRRNHFIPDVTKVEPGDYFPFADSRLHIFPQLSIPCDGILTHWRFLNKHRDIIGLHLAVFRQTSEETYDVIAETSIDVASTIDSKPHELPRNGVWMSFSVSPPAKVKTGDVIGFFYDSLDQSPWISPAIFTRDSESPTPLEKRTIVVELTAIDLLTKQLNRPRRLF